MTSQIIVTNYVSMATILHPKIQVETATKLTAAVNERVHLGLFRHDILVILDFEDILSSTTPVIKSVYSLFRAFLTTADSKRQIIVHTENINLIMDELVREFPGFEIKEITGKEEGGDTRWGSSVI